MMRFEAALSFALFMLSAFPMIPYAQTVQGPVEVRRLDSRPYTPGKDPDIDMYIGSWMDSQPRRTHGCLVERETLSKGDPAQPKRKGAVLKFVNRFVRATLYGHNTTAEVTLKGEQEILYITGGKGVITGGGKTAELREGILALIPEGVPYSMSNTGSEPLSLYLIAEPVTKPFKPLKEMIVKDEYAMPFSTSNGHWSMIIRNVFNMTKELSIIQYVNIITLDPMTIGHPHAHLPGCEEVFSFSENKSVNSRRDSPIFARLTAIAHTPISTAGMNW